MTQCWLKRLNICGWWLCMITDIKWDFRDLSWEFNQSIRRSVHCLCMIIYILWKHQRVGARGADHMTHAALCGCFSGQNRKLMYSDWTSSSNKSNSASCICIFQFVQQRRLLHLTMCLSDWRSFSFSVLKPGWRWRNGPDLVIIDGTLGRNPKWQTASLSSARCSDIW